WLDLFATIALGALNIFVRVVLFHLLSRVAPALEPLHRILICEALVLAAQGLLYPHLPAPVADEMSRRRPSHWQWNDDRMVLTLFVVFVTPVFVVLIYEGFLRGGVIWAVIAALTTLGPHYMAKLLNDRLLNKEALFEKKETELKEFVETVAHN